MKELKQYINEHIVGKITHYNKNDYYKEEQPNDYNELVKIIADRLKNSTDGHVDLFGIHVPSNIKSLKTLFRDVQNIAKKQIIELDFKGFDIHGVNSIEYLLYGCVELEYIYNFDSLDISKLTNMDFCFTGCNKLINIYGIENLDVSHIKSFNGLFSWCSLLEELDLSKWDVSNAKVMRNMFHGCFNLKTINCGSWDVSNVKDTECMFASCRNFKEDLSNWNLENCTSHNQMFYKCPYIVRNNQLKPKFV